MEADLSKPEWCAWAAAWLDTEGSICLFKRSDGGSFRLSVDIAQRDPEPLYMLQRAVGAGGVYVAANGMAMFSIRGTAAIKFLRLVAPWVVVKRELVDLSEAFIGIQQERWRGRYHEWTDEEHMRVAEVVAQFKAFNGRYRSKESTHGTPR